MIGAALILTREKEEAVQINVPNGFLSTILSAAVVLCIPISAGFEKLPIIRGLVTKNDARC
jgi:hypothetical protein